MTHDFLEDFTESLNKEGKLFLIGIFPKDMSGGFTSHNLDEAPNQTMTFPNGATYSLRQSVVMAIQHNLDLAQGPAIERPSSAANFSKIDPPQEVALPPLIIRDWRIDPPYRNQTYPIYRVRLSGSNDCMHGYLMEFAAWGEVDAEAKAGRLTEKDASGYGRPVGSVELNPHIRATALDYVKFSP